MCLCVLAITETAQTLDPTRRGPICSNGMKRTISLSVSLPSSNIYIHLSPPPELSLPACSSAIFSSADRVMGLTDRVRQDGALDRLMSPPLSLSLQRPRCPPLSRSLALFLLPNHTLNQVYNHSARRLPVIGRKGGDGGGWGHGGTD